MARQLVVVVVAVLIAVQIVRNATVDALADVKPRAASQLWSGHPAAELSLGMTEIASATRDRRPAPSRAFAIIADAARKAPLAPEPFLVKGVQAQLGGQIDVAEQAFLAAERRDPRSLPARYFLAELDFRAGKAGRALVEIADLVRLSPGGITGSAPYFADYARSRANWPQLRAMFRSNPEIENATLIALATDAANADTILALAPQSHQNAGSPWLPNLLNTLVNAGQYAKAKAIWTSVARVSGSSASLIHDQDFAQPEAPAPFNWVLTSSTVGLAERQPGGRLHVIFYGHEDGPLARQLLVLAPGTYRFSARAAGDPDQIKAFSWALRCANSQTALATISLDRAGRGLKLRVPAECPAEWLELAGAASDMPQQSEVTISGLDLVREASGG